MDNITNLSPLKTGALKTSSFLGKGPGQQDMLGFISDIVQQLKADPKNKEVVKAPPVAHARHRSAAAKIARALEKNDTSAADLQNMPPEKLAKKIAALLQKDTFTVQPALTSDLSINAAAQLQEEPTAADDIAQEIAALLSNDETSPAEPDLATTLNDIQPGSGNNSDLHKILAHLQQQARNNDTPLDPAILQELKDKVAELQLMPGAPDKDMLIQFKQDMIQSLKDQGLEPDAVEHYLAALIKFLRHGETDKPADQLMAAPATSTVPISPEFTTEKVPAPAKPTVAPPAQLIPSPADDAQTHDHIEARQEKPASAPKEASLPQAQLNTTFTPAPQQQNLSAKISGFGVNPQLINALANSDGGFGAEGFGANGQSPDMANNAVPLKPATVDTLNAQNFTNYLTSARTQQASTTQMVGIQLQRNINAKVDTMTLQLDPVELGRMDIKLKFAKDGSIKAHLSVDNPETLAMLQKDSHHLERILQQAGLNADENSLSFDLRHQGQQHNLEGFNNGSKGHPEEFGSHLNDTAAEHTLQAKIAIQTHGYITQSGVNIIV